MNAIKLKEQASHLRKGLSKSEDKYENVGSYDQVSVSHEETNVF